jgi:acyl-CoA thioester hydrolase
MTTQSPIITEVTLRYSDMDVLGHLNNAVYASLFEAGRVAYVEQVLLEVTPPGLGYVVVRLSIDFKAEARYPGIARIESVVTRLGGSSLVFKQTLHVGGKLSAAAEGICALFDLKERRAVRLPEMMRERIASMGSLHSAE